MLTLIIVLGLIVMGFAIWGLESLIRYKKRGYTLDLEDTRFARGFMIPGIVLSVILLIAWPLAYTDSLSQISEFQEFEAYLPELRASSFIHNRQSLEIEVFRYNAWLLRNQRWNSMPLLDMFVCDEIDSLEPIR